MKIVVLDGYTLFPGDLDMGPLDALGDMTLYDRTPQELVTARIGDCTDQQDEDLYRKHERLHAIFSKDLLILTKNLL